MEFDAVKLDAPIKMEPSANYWRERAECMEEWVCELLRKNQALRMNLEKQEALHGRGEGMTGAFSLRSVYQPTLPLGRTAFPTDPPRFTVDADTVSCPREECVEIRDSLIQNAVMNGLAPEAN